MTLLADSVYSFTFQPYSYLLPRPLQTHHGVWTERQGVIVRLEDATGQIGLGEIAPVSWFGSESLTAALQLCQSLPDQLSLEDILATPADYPACQFGLESAWEQLELRSHPDPQRTLSFCGLLPAGPTALDVWPTLWQQNYRTFKWKIGVYPLEQELDLFQQLVQQLPQTAKLRLDANGGFTLATAQTWLEQCDRTAHPVVEYLEQPLPPNQLSTMQSLATQYRTQLALDESIASLSQLEQAIQAGWSGIYVIKPAIIGSPRQLRRILQNNAIEAVFSSVFETQVGYLAGLRLAEALSAPTRAISYSLQPTVGPPLD